MLISYPSLGERMHIWGNVPFLTAGVIYRVNPILWVLIYIQGATCSMNYRIMGNSTYFGGNDLQHSMLACLMASDSHCVRHSRVNHFYMGYGPSYLRK